MEIEVNNQQDLALFGERLGSVLRGGETIELIGDVGAGKTTLTKTIAKGMGITSEVTSPSYTLNQVYEATTGLWLRHYDFYRLTEPGILAAELEEALRDANAVTIIEWGDIVAGVLPVDHLQIRITVTSEQSRKLALSGGGEMSERLVEQLR